MGLFSRFESKAEDVIEGGAGASSRGGIEPVKLAKRAYKEMEREKMVGVGHEYAPTLYNVLVSFEDDRAMSGYYPSLAGEIETYLQSRASQSGLVFDCQPLVRFIVDEGLKRGKFDIIAESVSPAIIAELRHEEMVHYGLEEPEPQEDYGWQPEQDAYEQPYDEPYGQSQPYAEPAYDKPAPYEEPDHHAAGAAQEFAAAAGAAGAAAGAAAGVAERTYPPTEPPRPDQPMGAAERTVMIDNVHVPQGKLVNAATGEAFTLSTERTVIGREQDCDVIILDPSVSRRHAEILHSESGWLVRDTGSTNGTKINGVATTQSRIYNGDVLDLGKTKLEFQEE